MMHSYSLFGHNDDYIVLVVLILVVMDDALVQNTPKKVSVPMS